MTLRDRWLGVNMLRGAVVCGIIALLISMAAGVHSDNFSDRLKDPWFGWYLLLTGPVSISGVILGTLSKDSPRTAGIVLSGSMLLALVGCLASG